MNNQLIYLASPYSHEDMAVRHNRHIDIARIAGHLIAKGKTLFCPITHSHSIAEYSEVHSMSHTTWMHIDLTIMQHCTELYVVKLDGWKESKGVTEEIQFAKDNDMPITYIDLQGEPTDDK